MDKRLAALDMTRALSALSPHAELLGARGRTTDPRVQAELAPMEHRAFAREFAQESPIRAAVSLPFAIPAYTAAKAVGLQNARSPASWEEMKQGFIGLNEGLGVEGLRQSILQKLQSFGGGGAQETKIPTDANGNPMNTQFADRAAMDKPVQDAMTPPQWVDHRNRINEKHPDYKFNPGQAYRDYMQWVADSNAAGQMVFYPKDRVEAIARSRAGKGNLSAEEAMLRTFEKRRK